MMPGKSILNPHATPYIPLPKNLSGLGFEGENKATKKTSSLAENTEAVGNTWGSLHRATAAVEHDIQSKEKLHVCDESSSNMAQPRNYDDFYDEKQSITEDYNQILDYLLAMFPDFSIESLAELLNANDGDFNDTIDMLEQLQWGDDNFKEPCETSEIRNMPVNSSRTSSST